jgi:hypothetical protein
VLFQYVQHLLSYYAATPGIWKERLEIAAEGKRCVVNNIYYALDNNNESLARVLATTVKR